MHRKQRTDRTTIFLFLGELFLIPHLLPIAIALARRPAAPRITLLVATSVHEEIIAEALSRLRITNILVKRARGFRTLPPGTRTVSHLPFKPLLLLRNAIAILRHDLAVVAERTSLWLPYIARCGAKFVYNEHGAGPHANFASPRNRHATKILMPGVGMAKRALRSGPRDAPIEVVGYVKRDYIKEVGSSGSFPVFAEKRPTIVYVPHWLENKSSWWAIGEDVLAYFAQSRTYNLILAPHMRLPEKDPEFERRISAYRNCPNIHIDWTSFSLVDQSYINGADIYLGDGSSQVVEFAERPRPAIFLNPRQIDWSRDPRFGHWCMGDVVEDIAGLDAALAAAADAQAVYAPVQRAYVARMMGSDNDSASERAADIALEVLGAGRGSGPVTGSGPRARLRDRARS